MADSVSAPTDMGSGDRYPKTAVASCGPEDVAAVDK
jgi:hypothetical protein